MEKKKRYPQHGITASVYQMMKKGTVMNRKIFEDAFPYSGREWNTVVGCIKNEYEIGKYIYKGKTEDGELYYYYSKTGEKPETSQPETEQQLPLTEDVQHNWQTDKKFKVTITIDTVELSLHEIECIGEVLNNYFSNKSKN